MIDNRYAGLGLTDNPFPLVPTVDPASPDIRMNGSIYNEDIFRNQIAALRQRLARRENIIYAQNTKFTMGVGKSALIAREWRRLQEQSPETTVYVRCGSKTQASTVDGACNLIVDLLFRKGALWKALCGILSKYVREAEKPILDRGIVDNLVALHPKAPRMLSARALMLWDVKGTVDAIATWLEAIAPRVSRDIAVIFLSSMLSEPGKLLDAYIKKAKRREVVAFITILEFLRISGVGYLCVFLDQFEELFHGRGKKEVIALASSMRQILEACPGLATFVVTLHPSAAMQILLPEGQSLTTIAPVDDRHVVELPNIAPRAAVQLAQTYIETFRLPGAGGIASSSPFDDECIEAISTDQEGNIRKTLQALRSTVETAVENRIVRIDKVFFDAHYREITGRVSEQDLELL